MDTIKSPCCIYCGKTILTGFFCNQHEKDFDISEKQLRIEAYIKEINRINEERKQELEKRAQEEKELQIFKKELAQPYLIRIKNAKSDEELIDIINDIYNVDYSDGY
jgi:single-stranded DNA-specific DHH superfamily exonuclease